MKVLVTGGTGFIGYDLVSRLVKEGHEVVCSVRKTSNTEKIRSLGVELRQADIEDEKGFSELVSEIRPRVVYHCAAVVWDDDEKKMFDVNVRGTSVVCEACYSHGVDRFIHLSSVAVVSGNEKVPLHDGMEYKCSDAYGRSKAEAEKIVRSYRDKGLKTAIIRPCMVYGEDEPHALGKIMSSISRRKIPIPDIPEINAALALVYISNVTDVLMLALCKEEALEGTFIVADREVITIRKFIEILAEGLEAPYPLVIPSWVVRPLMLIPPIKKKMKRIFKDRVYDISRIVDVLGYSPKVSTEEGLKRTAAYWKNSDPRVTGRDEIFLPGDLPGT